MPSNFKSDDSFLRKLVVGAAGVNATIQRLKELGFNPIELERGSTGFKIWKKIKIKRIRVPDIICQNSGLRFESRGKTKLEISMSHSLNDPKRAWDYGMRDDDFVSIVAFHQNVDNPVDVQRISPVHFISIKDMRDSFKKKQFTISKPKGFEEGSEIRVIWTSAVANQKSQANEVTNERIQMLPLLDSAKKQTIQMQRNKGVITLVPQVRKDDIVQQNQIIASVVPINLEIPCPETVDENFFIEKLKSVNLTERYAAAKVLRYKGYSPNAKNELIQRMNDPDEDIYVRLEAAAALAIINESSAWSFLEGKLNALSMNVPLETQLETIIVISEIQNEKSENLLINVLIDKDRDNELRAGAAWALGEFSSKKTAGVLVDSFGLVNSDIKIEAARSLSRMGEEQKYYLLSLMKSIPESKRDGISWVLSRIGNFDPTELTKKNDDNLRKWLSYILGYGRSNFNETYINSICKSDPEVYFAASVLWQILDSWINGLTEY